MPFHELLFESGQFQVVKESIQHILMFPVHLTRVRGDFLQELENEPFIEIHQVVKGIEAFEEEGGGDGVVVGNEIEQVDDGFDDLLQVVSEEVLRQFQLVELIDSVDEEVQFVQIPFFFLIVTQVLQRKVGVLHNGLEEIEQVFEHHVVQQVVLISLQSHVFEVD
jgi:hypothetical protein